MAHQVAHDPGTAEASRAHLNILLLHDVRAEATRDKSAMLQQKLNGREHQFFFSMEMAHACADNYALDLVLHWLSQTDPKHDWTPPDIIQLHQTRRFHCTQAAQLYVARLYRDHWQWWAQEYWGEIQTLRIRLHKERRRRQRIDSTGG